MVLIIILLGGCQVDKDETSTNPSEIAKEDLPDVHAFNDTFTRDFLQSTEETEKGFFPFLSKTKKYKMDFPAGGVIDNRMYSVKENVHEEVTISIEDETGFGMHVIYFADNTKDLLKDDLNAFKKRLGYDGDFEEMKKNDQTLYYAHYERYGSRTYVGYVLNEQDSGGIEIIYKIDCQDEKEEICEKNRQSDKRRAMKWMESVQVINGEGDDDHE